MIDYENVQIHKDNCCVIHGCYYNDYECPIINGKELQNSLLCEECKDDSIITDILRILRIDKEELI